jgi:hypothetical protein
MFKRKQLFIDLENESMFFWGTRQTFKSTLLKYLFPQALFFDLLFSDEYEKFLKIRHILERFIWQIHQKLN